MYREYLHTKEQKFGNLKIAHFGLFFLFLEPKRMLALEMNKNEVERARLVKKQNFPWFYVRQTDSTSLGHLLSFKWSQTK